MLTLRFVLSGAGLLFAAAPALAQTDAVIIEGAAPTAIVGYADLNLASAEGKRTLERRVAHAASSLCLGNQRVALGELLDEQRCYRLAMSKARADMAQAIARANVQFALEETVGVGAK
jgi:UrcA family protein